MKLLCYEDENDVFQNTHKPLQCVKNLKNRYTIYEILQAYYDKKKYAECIIILHFDHAIITDLNKARWFIKNILNNEHSIPALKIIKPAMRNQLYMSIAFIIHYYIISDTINVHKQYSCLMSSLINQIYKLYDINPQGIRDVIYTIIRLIAKNNTVINNNDLLLIYTKYFEITDISKIDFTYILPTVITSNIDISSIYHYIADIIGKQSCSISTNINYCRNIKLLEQLYDYDPRARQYIQSILMIYELSN